VIGQGLAVAQLATDVLNSISEHFDQAGVALPDRRILVPGDSRSFAWDCEQLAVSLAGIGWGQALDAAPVTPRAGSPASVISIRHAVIVATLIRCTPNGRNGKPPDPAELFDAGQRFMRDAGLLSQSMVTLCARLRHSLPREASVQPGAVEPIGPEGGYHAAETTLTITAGELE
jgi:hypothetical protein